MAANESGDGDQVELMDFQEEELASSVSNLDDTKFDTTIGHIEDIIMEDGFQKMQGDFMEQHYHHFDDDEENKFIYTDIHKQYLSLVEKYLEEQLVARMPGFTMEAFSTQLETRKKKKKDSLEGEIFEILLTFTDFLAFKEMFLDYKAEKEGRTVDLSDGFIVTPYHEPSTSNDKPSSSTSEAPGKN
ncbi:ADP-ribosylation factor-like protein 2-binding protein [Holothuria leucospilota]|uniref:ADP-ribosylation factor-like protein 2-binding protein n=1 Tax=Holothuria leucospilota TaxID=206669 RepID=A0A9Q1HDV9_HOLLE|nr:ADP-ribosylation factor-like protein 2-binding protein [Holothuria leucospilota]